jgi:hypothetical protein
LYLAEGCAREAACIIFKRLDPAVVASLADAARRPDGIVLEPIVTP